MKKSPRHKSIGFHMAVVQQLLKKRNQKALKDAGFSITLEQMVVLEMLYFQGEMNMTEVAKGVWKQNANITRIVDKLEKQNLLIRIPLEGDRRANILSITKEGSQYIKNTAPIVGKTYKESISCITKEEEDFMLMLLKKIITNLS